MEASQELDFKKYFVEKGEPGFSPERNKAVVENSIKKYEAMRARRKKDYAEQVAERADAVAHYLKSRVAYGTPIEKYFGRRELAHLQGQKILQKLIKTRQGYVRVLDSVD